MPSVAPITRPPPRAVLLFDLATVALSAAHVVADILVAWQFYRNDTWGTWVALQLLVLACLMSTAFFCGTVLCSHPVFRYYSLRLTQRKRASESYPPPRFRFSHLTRHQQVTVIAATLLMSPLLPAVVLCVNVLYDYGLFFKWVPRKSATAWSQVDKEWATLAQLSSATADLAASCRSNSDSPCTCVDESTSPKTSARRQRIMGKRSGAPQADNAEEISATGKTGKGFSCVSALKAELQSSRLCVEWIRRIRRTDAPELFFLVSFLLAVGQVLLQSAAIAFNGRYRHHSVYGNANDVSNLQIVSIGVSVLSVWTFAFSLETFDLRVSVFGATFVVSQVVALSYILLCDLSTSFTPNRQQASDVFFSDVVAIFGAGLIIKNSYTSVTKSFLPDTTLCYPALSALLSFVRNGTTRSEKHNRIMHAAHVFALRECNTDAELPELEQATMARHERAEAIARISAPGQRTSTAVWSPWLLSKANPGGSLKRAIVDVVALTDLSKSWARLRMVGLAIIQVALLLFPLIHTFLVRLPNEHSSLQQSASPLARTWSDKRSLQGGAVMMCSASVCTMAVLSSSVWEYFQLVLSVDLTDACARHGSFGMDPDSRSGSETLLDEALEAIHAFVAPTPAAVVTATTPHAAVSRAVSELVVGPYLPAAQLLMGHLPSAECSALRGALNLTDDVD